MSQVNTDKLLNDLRVVIHDAEELLKATAGQAGEHVAEIRARAEASLRSAKAQLSSLGCGARSGLHDAVGIAGSYMRKNPWVAVGAGAAIGVLVGLLISRRAGGDN